MRADFFGNQYNAATGEEFNAGFFGGSPGLDKKDRIITDRLWFHFMSASWAGYPRRERWFIKGVGDVFKMY